MMYCWKLRNRKIRQSAAENKAAFAYYKKEVLPCHAITVTKLILQRKTFLLFGKYGTVEWK